MAKIIEYTNIFKQNIIILKQMHQWYQFFLTYHNIQIQKHNLETFLIVLTDLEDISFEKAEIVFNK